MATHGGHVNTISAIVSAGKPPCFRPFLKSLKDFSRNRSVLRSLQASKSEPWLKRTFSADASVQRPRASVCRMSMSCKHICHVAVSPTRAVSEDLIEIVKNSAEHCCSLIAAQARDATRGKVGQSSRHMLTSDHDDLTPDDSYEG